MGGRGACRFFILNDSLAGSQKFDVFSKAIASTVSDRDGGDFDLSPDFDRLPKVKGGSCQRNRRGFAISKSITTKVQVYLKSSQVRADRLACSKTRS